MTHLVGDDDLLASWDDIDAAVDLFRTAGLCVFEQALPIADVDACHAAIAHRMLLLDRQLAARNVDLNSPWRFNEVCRRRLGRYDVRGWALADPAFDGSSLWADAVWLPFVHAVLGEDAVELWRGVVDNRPGSETQGWHRDGEILFADVELPPHCVTVFLPLLDLPAGTDLGPTQFYPGSHACRREHLYTGLNDSSVGGGCHLPFCTPVLARGDLIAFDYRVIHRGQANMSERTSRPMLYAVYAKPWFRDPNNFPADRPLFDDDDASPTDTEDASHAPSDAPPPDASPPSTDAPPSPDAPPLPDAPSEVPRAMAWLRCHDDSAPSAWDSLGRRVRHDHHHEELPPLLAPPEHVHYGGVPGDAAHERLSRDEIEERVGFTLTASIVAETPEVLRSLPLHNLPSDALPAELEPPEHLVEWLAAAVRAGPTGPADASRIFVAPDAYGGHGLFAAVELPAHTLVGEYLGTLCRETGSTGSSTTDDGYVMRYPDAAGALYVTARDAGSLARFVNHAPTGAAANNCTCWAVLVDGAYHTCVVTTRAVAAREELAYDYGDAYWAARGGTPTS